MTPERLQDHLAEARAALEPAWTPGRGEQVRARIPAGRRQQRRRRVATRLAMGASLVLTGIAGMLFWREPPPPAPVPVEVVALAPAAPPPAVGPAEKRHELPRVIAPDGRAEVEASSTRVLVDRQRASTDVTISTDSESRRERPSDAPSEANVTPATPPIPPEPVREALTTLLRRADEARSEGRLVTAVSLLRQVVREHPDDPRTPLASFSLGRLLLEELDSPVEAFEAFSQARTAAPDSALAEDAFAREVECLALTKDARLSAHARAFETTFPHSARLSRVRHLGGAR
jgi:TolA-binding protein